MKTLLALLLLIPSLSLGNNFIYLKCDYTTQDHSITWELDLEKNIYLYDGHFYYDELIITDQHYTINFYRDPDGTWLRFQNIIDRYTLEMREEKFKSDGLMEEIQLANCELLDKKI